MQKFEFNISNISNVPVQDKELLIALRDLNASGKKFVIVSHTSLTDKISEKTVIQIIGDPSFYYGILKYVISDSNGNIEYAPPSTGNSEHINMLTIEEP